MTDLDDDVEPVARTRRRHRDLTADEILVRNAAWPGFNFGKSGWPDPDMLRGWLDHWKRTGRPVHDNGTACLCPRASAAWRCACPDTCPVCERRSGRGPFGRHRYGGLWPVCPSPPRSCTCPDYTPEELDAEIERHTLERWFLDSVDVHRVPPPAGQGVLF